MFFKRKESEAFKWFKDNLGAINVNKDNFGFISIEIQGVNVGGKMNSPAFDSVFLNDGFKGNLSRKEASLARKILETEIKQIFRSKHERESKERSEQFMKSIRSNQ